MDASTTPPSHMLVGEQMLPYLENANWLDDVSAIRVVDPHTLQLICGKWRITATLPTALRRTETLSIALAIEDLTAADRPVRKKTVNTPLRHIPSLPDKLVVKAAVAFGFKLSRDAELKRELDLLSRLVRAISPAGRGRIAKSAVDALIFGHMGVTATTMDGDRTLFLITVDKTVLPDIR